MIIFIYLAFIGDWFNSVGWGIAPLPLNQRAAFAMTNKQVFIVI
ncbi:MAG: hypothetical protein ACTH4U_07330 [Pseudoalteromonas prydzensis]